MDIEKFQTEYELGFLMEQNQGKTVLKEYFGTEVDVTIPEVVTNIALNGFSCNQSLVSVILPEGMKHLDSMTFSKCTQLKTVNSLKNFCLLVRIPFVYVKIWRNLQFQTPLFL